MSKEPLSYEPEPLIEGRKRYDKALIHLYNVHRVRYMNIPGPQFQRDNVFDFDNGLRLIISMEFAPINKLGERGPFEHISASWLSKPPEGIVMMDESIRIYSYISKRNPKTKPHWHHLDPKSGVFHMLFRRDTDFRLDDWDEEGNWLNSS